MQVGLHDTKDTEETKWARAEGLRRDRAVLLPPEEVVGPEREGDQSSVLVASQVSERVVHLRDVVLRVEREGGSVGPADIVGTGQRQEAAGGLTRTGGIDVLDVQTLGHDLWVADEVAGVIRIQQRTEAERHRIP